MCHDIQNSQNIRWESTNQTNNVRFHPVRAIKGKKQGQNIKISVCRNTKKSTNNNVWWYNMLILGFSFVFAEKDNKFQFEEYYLLYKITFG